MAPELSDQEIEGSREKAYRSRILEIVGAAALTSMAAGAARAQENPDGSLVATTPISGSPIAGLPTNSVEVDNSGVFQAEQKFIRFDANGNPMQAPVVDNGKAEGIPIATPTAVQGSGKNIPKSGGSNITWYPGQNTLFMVKGPGAGEITYSVLRDPVASPTTLVNGYRLAVAGSSFTASDLHLNSDLSELVLCGNTREVQFGLTNTGLKESGSSTVPDQPGNAAFEIADEQPDETVKEVTGPIPLPTPDSQTVVETDPGSLDGCNVMIMDSMPTYMKVPPNSVLTIPWLFTGQMFGPGYTFEVTSDDPGVPSIPEIPVGTDQQKSESTSSWQLPFNQEGNVQLRGNLRKDGIILSTHLISVDILL